MSARQNRRRNNPLTGIRRGLATVHRSRSNFGGKEMVTWNYGIMWKGIAKADPSRPAQMFGDVVYSWGDFHQRSNALAADMLAAGMGSQSKVAHYLYNCPEYL